ncbi:MAG: cytochrome c [Paracoccaceae bacterium]
MNIPRMTGLTVLIGLGTAALAHQGIQNAAVKARMDSMSAIATHMKTLGDMARGKATFDTALARHAAQGISLHAAEVPTLFEVPENDPKSEALPIIWTQFDDFEAKAVQMEKVAADLATTLSEPDDLPAALKALGATCTSCHETYRQEQ